MAVTKGQGNPDWTKDETILALNLFLELNQNIPNSNDKRVIELSEILRNNPFHSIETRKPSFRNPTSVNFKLQNIKQVATGKGLENFSKMDKLVWDEYGNNKELVKELAIKIKEGIKIFENENDDEETLEIFNEGRIITALHKRRERNPSLRDKKIKQLEKQNKIYCEICNTKPYINKNNLMYSIFECHHIHLLSDTNEVVTKLDDIAFLCSNCHKMLHRIIAIEKKWFSVDEIKKYIDDNKI
jgi:5-methylcytosine-specific restriction protein A